MIARVYAFAAIGAALLGGCAFNVEGGSQTAVQTSGSIREEGAIAFGGGIGVVDNALTVREHLAIGSNLHTGRRVGEFATGVEFQSFDESGTIANHLEIAAGGTVGEAADHFDSLLFFLRVGRGFALARFDVRRFLSLSLDPSLGIAIPYGDHAQSHVTGFVGLTFVLRYDVFSPRVHGEW